MYAIWWANPNWDLDLNMDLTTFGFGFEDQAGFGFKHRWICQPLCVWGQCDSTKTSLA